MSKSLRPPVGASMNAFHEMAARRGDGLHPLLLEALAKSGPISGPPADTEKNDENVIRVQFGSAPASKRRGKETMA